MIAIFPNGKQLRENAAPLVIRTLRAEKVLLEVSTYDLSKGAEQFRPQSQRGADLRVFRLDESRQL